MSQKTDLYERRFVECPYQRARAYLAESLQAWAQSGQTGVVTLRLPMAGIEVQKNVVVGVAIGTDPMHFDQPWKLHWTPESGGPYPDFDGELTVRADEDYTSAVLELRGGYEPPGGAAGVAFDWALGSRIASATAQALLSGIAGAMAKRYAHDEAAKRA